jgi:citrate synthase
MVSGQSGKIRSDIAWSTPDRITIRGKDLPGEILGKMSLADFSYFQLTGNEPTAGQSRVYNAILIALVEHGLTPSALAARLTYAGAPESLQAAVAAGLCGLGSVFVGTTEGAALMLNQALAEDDGTLDLSDTAARIVADFRARDAIIPGLGHPFHKPIDPRTPRLFEIAAESGLAGRYVELIQRVGHEAEKSLGKPLPVNVTGAIAALTAELGIPPRIVRGLGVMARAIGLVGHLLEESTQPLALELWHRTDNEASAHLRPHPSHAAPATAHRSGGPRPLNEPT